MNPKLRPIKWLRLYCQWCKHVTIHKCLPDVQGVTGLPWQCVSCRRTTEFSHEQASKGQRLN